MDVSGAAVNSTSAFFTFQSPPIDCRQESEYVVMFPFWSTGRGGNQEKVRLVAPVSTIENCWGGPLGTVRRE